MNRLSARTGFLLPLIGLLACLALLYACEQKREWRDVWSDIAPAELPQSKPAVIEALPAPEVPPPPSVPTAAEIAAQTETYLLNLKADPDGPEIGRGLLLKPALGLALAYVGDYKGENASAEIGGKTCIARLSGYDAATGFALAKLETAFDLPAPSPDSEISQGDELLLVAASSGAAVTVETRAAQNGNAAGAAPLFTAFPAARNLAGAAVFKRDGARAGMAFIPQGSDLMALHPAEYLLGRCAALADAPPPPIPTPTECPPPPSCPLCKSGPESGDDKGGEIVAGFSGTEVLHKAAWLGAGVIELNPAWAKKNGVAREQGLYIKEIRPASPMEAAGARVGDMLLELDGRPLETRRQLAEAMLELRPGVPASIKTQSPDGRTLTLAVTPGEKK